MTTYILTHNHKHGTSNYIFTSNEDSLNVSLYHEEDIIDEDTYKVLQILNVDYEHGRWGESLEIVDYDMSNGVKHIQL